jgi:hypothetical protein
VSYTDGDINTDDVGISLNLPSTTNFSGSWGTAQELCEFEILTQEPLAAQRSG